MEKLLTVLIISSACLSFATVPSHVYYINSDSIGTFHVDDSASPQEYGAAGDGVADDTNAMRKCFANNLNIKLSGTYKITDSIGIRSDHKIFGENATIVFKTTKKKMLSSYNASSWQISGKLKLIGSGNKIGTASALSIVGGKNIDISGLTILNISGTGILFTRGIYQQRGNCVLMTNTLVADSWIGIQTFAASEYHSFTNVNVVECNSGAEIRSGNISWTGGNIVDNKNGLFIGGRYGTNNSHGIFTGVNINHNVNYNLLCDSIEYGQTFTGCHFYGESDRSIIIKNSKAVAFNGGIIDGRVDIADKTGYQYFNAVHLEPQFNLSNFKDQAIFTNCFTRDKGLYPGNSIKEKRTGSVYPATDTVHIASRVELFVDDLLVQELNGNATLKLHHPQPKEIAIVHDAPWEGSGSGYHSIFKDGDIYRMYYKSSHLSVGPAGKVSGETHPLFTCYAESDDGIHWRKPELGLHEFKGSAANNIVIAGGPADPGHVAVFKDENPNAPPDARYKAMLVSNGMHPFKSSDGIHWSPMTKKAVITDGAFDSQNLAFWDSINSEYRAYWRYFTEGVTPLPYSAKTWEPGGVRAIRTATSKDFLHWTSQADLRYVDSPPEELYTSQIKPYFRAPHLFIGFPTRYLDRGWSESMHALPDSENREWRAASSPRFGTVLTEGLFMASRDGVTFKRWNEAFLRPGIERPGTWAYGNQYIAWSIVETKSAEQQAPNELSLYATESYWTDSSGVLRRYTLRMDGFVSVYAPMSGGELILKPITFIGNKLVLNFSSSAAGGIQVEIQDVNGEPLRGFRLEDCPPVFGDTIDRTITWKKGNNVAALAGKPVRLRFVIKDANLYSFRFK